MSIPSLENTISYDSSENLNDKKKSSNCIFSINCCGGDTTIDQELSDDTTTTKVGKVSKQVLPEDKSGCCNLL